jgi:two-component system, sensor histidine kinase LadS
LLGAYLVRFILLLCLSGLVVSPVVAHGTAQGLEESATVLSNNTTSIEISDRFAIAEDPTGTQSLEQMMAQPFVRTNAKLLKGYSNSTYWLRFELKSEASEVEQWWLDIEPPFLDSVHLFSPDGHGGFTVKRTGDRQRFSTREFAHASFVFRLSPPLNTKQTYYLRIQGEGSVWVRALIWNPVAFGGYAAQLGHGHGMVFGMLLLLMLMTALQGFSFKDKLYIVFVAYVATTFVFLGSGTGFFARYLPDQYPLIAETLGPVSVCLNITTYAVFCRYFLYERAQDQLFRSLFFALAALGVVAAILVAFVNFRWLMPGLLVLKVLGTVVPAFSAGARLFKGHFNDRLVWLGIIANIPVQIVLLIRLAGQGDQNAQWLSLHWFTAALLIHFLLISFALVERARRVSQERRDFQQQASAELQLKQAAEKTGLEQRSFLSMVAHELRSPLSIASLANDNLRQLLGKTPDPQWLTRLDRVETSLDQMNFLIEVCLSHEKQVAASPLSLLSQVDVNELINTTNAMLNEQANARLIWAVDPNIRSLQFVGNNALIGIALRNLIENAIRYDPSESPIEIQIAPSNGERNEVRCLVFKIQDRGPGIDSASLQNVFNQFSRGPEGKNDNLGLGLGLFIVSRIAAMHNGSVTHDPREGGGSLFTLTLPYS